MSEEKKLENPKIGRDITNKELLDLLRSFFLDLNKRLDNIEVALEKTKESTESGLKKVSDNALRSADLLAHRGGGKSQNNAWLKFGKKTKEDDGKGKKGKDEKNKDVQEPTWRDELKI